MSHSDPMHYKNERSGILTNGIERSAHRALLYSTGLEEDDLRKPLVAIVNSFTEMVPGHIHLRELAQAVAQGVWEAGGVPREFDTIAICDGICQGHKGMSYPLPSRELIADSIEYMVEAHQFDAMVLMPGCDKIVPTVNENSVARTIFYPRPVGFPLRSVFSSKQKPPFSQSKKRKERQALLSLLFCTEYGEFCLTWRQLPPWAG